jgi:DNA mismatch endonuclease (patch repair protein)
MPFLRRSPELSVSNCSPVCLSGNSNTPEPNRARWFRLAGICYFGDVADTISPERRSSNMSKIRSKDMAPELSVRRLLHEMGYRYRLHRKALPGKPDIIFPARRKVIFVHGCFWHQHADSSCKITRVPKSRLEYWRPKLARNQERDKANIQELRKLGWKVLILWECEIEDVPRLRSALVSFLGMSRH